MKYLIPILLLFACCKDKQHCNINGYREYFVVYKQANSEENAGGGFHFYCKREPTNAQIQRLVFRFNRTDTAKSYELKETFEPDCGEFNYRTYIISDNQNNTPVLEYIPSEKIARIATSRSDDQMELLQRINQLANEFTIEDSVIIQLIYID